MIPEPSLGVEQRAIIHHWGEKWEGGEALREALFLDVYIFLTTTGGGVVGSTKICYNLFLYSKSDPTLLLS